MAEMTSRQRMLTALTRGVPDRLPVTTHHVMQYFLDKYMGGIDPYAFFDRFGIDAWLWTVPYKPDTSKGEYFDPNQTFIHPLDHTHRVVSDNWRIEAEEIPDPQYTTTRYNFVTPKGTLSMVLQGSGYTDWVVEPLIKNKRDIDLIAEYVTHPNVRCGSGQPPGRGIWRTRPHPGSYLLLRYLRSARLLARRGGTGWDGTADSGNL